MKDWARCETIIEFFLYIPFSHSKSHASYAD